MQQHELIFIFLFSLAWGLLLAYFAKVKRYNPSVWFFVGFFFGIFGLVIFLCYLYFYPIQPVPPPIDLQGHKEPEIEMENWFYLDQERKSQGPLTLSVLKELYENEQITAETYLWNPSMSSWKKEKELKLF